MDRPSVSHMEGLSVDREQQDMSIHHNTLYGFIQGGGVEATMEENLDHHLAGLVHKLLFQVFLYVQKSYNSLYRGRCIEILRGYVLGPDLHILIQRLWDYQAVIPKAVKLFG